MTQEQEQIIEDQPLAAVQESAQAPAEEIEIVEDAPEVVAEEAIAEQKQFDPKTDKVDFSTPEQQEKFNHVYKQMKMSDARNQMLNEMLQTQQKRLEDLETRFKNTDSADAEQILLHKIKQARDSGDDMAEFSATKEMVEFLADKKISEKVNKPVQQVNYQDQQNAQYAAHVMQETDNNGNLLRPWLYETHPDYNNVVNQLEIIHQKYIGDPQAVPKSLSELDQIMRAKMTNKQPPSGPQPRTPNPMQGGNLTNAGKKTTIKMTRAEVDMLNRLNKSLPPGEKLSPQRYAARLEKTRGKK